MVRHLRAVLTDSHVALHGNLTAEVIRIFSAPHPSNEYLLHNASFNCSGNRLHLEALGRVVDAQTTVRPTSLIRIRFSKVLFLTISCARLHITMRIVSGVDERSVTTISSTVATVVRINGNSSVGLMGLMSDADVQLNGVFMTVNVRNGTFTDNVFPGSGQEEYYQ